MHRRRFLQIAVPAVGAAAFGCSPEQRLPAIPNEAEIATVALVAIDIGGKVAYFPHPVAKITGVVLQLSGFLVIAYIALENSLNGEFTISVRDDEVAAIRNGITLVALRQDGKAAPLPDVQIENA